MVVRRNRLLWQIGVKHGWRLACYVIFAFILNQIIIYGNDYIAKATDKVLAGSEIEILHFLLPLVIMALLGAAAAYGKNFCASIYNAVVQRDMKNAISRHILELPLSYFDEKGTGNVMTRVSSDMNEAGRFFSEILPELLVNLITVITVTWYLVKMDAMLIVILFASYPFMLLVADWLSKRLAKIVKGYRSRMDDRTQAAYDVIQGMEVGRSYNLYRIMKKRLDTIIDDIAAHAWKSTRISSLGWSLKSILTTIPVVICYLFALRETLKGRITTGEMLAFTVLLGRILYPLGDVVFCLNDIREINVSFERIQELYEKQEEKQGTKDYRADAALLWNMADNEMPDRNRVPAICWNQVSFSYQKEHPILKDISFQIRQGETIAFVGGSGEGKTTIFKLLCGFYQKEKGSYELYGKEYEMWDLQAARVCFSLVSQNVFLFPVSIWENVAFGKENVTKEEVVAACKNANIHDFIEKLPDGYDTLVGERGVRLSGGERQRISIARAFLKNAPILLLDEPTASVDAETEAELQEAMAHISKGRTVIIIAHRLSTVEHADCIYVVQNGVVAEQGTHGELINRGGAYTELMKCGDVNQTKKEVNGNAAMPT